MLVVGRLLTWDSKPTLMSKLKVADAVEGFVPGDETSLFQRVVVQARLFDKRTGIASTKGVLAFMYFQTKTPRGSTLVNGQDWLRRS